MPAHLSTLPGFLHPPDQIQGEVAGTSLRSLGYYLRRHLTERVSCYDTIAAISAQQIRNPRLRRRGIDDQE
jgi:hypothetical protein